MNTENIKVIHSPTKLYEYRNLADDIVGLRAEIHLKDLLIEQLKERIQNLEEMFDEDNVR